MKTLESIKIEELVASHVDEEWDLAEDLGEEVYFPRWYRG